MPVTKSAKRAWRRARRLAKINQRVRKKLAAKLRQARHQPSEATLSATFSLLDQAVKKRVLHRNRAARLKSRLARLLPQKSTPKTSARKK